MDVQSPNAGPGPFFHSLGRSLMRMGSCKASRLDIQDYALNKRCVLNYPGR